MPKMKTHKGTQKRFRLTANGKVKHRGFRSGDCSGALLGAAKERFFVAHLGDEHGTRRALSVQIERLIESCVR